MNDLATRFIPAPPGPRLSPVLPPVPLAGALRATHRLLAKRSLGPVESVSVSGLHSTTLPRSASCFHREEASGPSFPACFFSNHIRFLHTRTLASSCFPPLRHPPRVRFDCIACAPVRLVSPSSYFSPRHFARPIFRAARNRGYPSQHRATSSTRPSSTTDHYRRNSPVLNKVFWCLGD
jgi:hypothetical protein